MDYTGLIYAAIVLGLPVSAALGGGTRLGYGALAGVGVVLLVALPASAAGFCGAVITGALLAIFTYRKPAAQGK